MSSVYESRFWLDSYNWATTHNLTYPKNPAFHLLRNASTYYPERIATWFYGAEITFDELYKKVCRLANVFVEKGIQKGDRVGLLLPNCPQFVISYWAILMSGAIVVNLNPMYTSEELMYQFEDADLNCLITYDAVVPKIKPLCTELSISTVIVTKLSDFMLNIPVSTPAELGLEEDWMHFSQVLETDQRWHPPLIDIQSEDPAVIQYTGGTTGVPKGAVLTQANLTAATLGNTHWTMEAKNNTPIRNRNILSIIPFCHIYGEACCITYAAFNNATLVILPRFDINEVFDTIEKFEAFLYWPAVPTMIQALFNSPRMKEVDWHNKFIYTGTGAAPASMELIHKCQANDFNFNEGYGSSETTACAISTPFGKLKPMSVGVPFISADLRLVDEDGNDVPLGERGEIIMKSPYVMKEY